MGERVVDEDRFTELMLLDDGTFETDNEDEVLAGNGREILKFVNSPKASYTCDVHLSAPNNHKILICVDLENVYNRTAHFKSLSSCTNAGLTGLKYVPSQWNPWVYSTNRYVEALKGFESSVRSYVYNMCTAPIVRVVADLTAKLYDMFRT